MRSIYYYIIIIIINIYLEIYRRIIITPRRKEE